MNPAVMALYLRSVRMESRRLVTYLVRLGLVVTILFSLITAHVTSVFAGAPGLHFFKGVCFINLVVNLLVGVAYFTSAIAEEREEMTLGLLRMTGLSPLAILFGKSTSRLVGASSLILAQLPFTLLAVSLGGVATIQVYSAYVCMLAFMFMLSNVALLFSVLCRKAVGAGASMLIAVAVYFLLPIIFRSLASLGIGLEWIARGGAMDASLKDLATLSLKSNAFMTMAEIVEPMFAGPVVGVQVVSNVLIGVFCFLVAWAIFNRSTREQKDASPSRGLVRRGQRRMVGLGAGKAWRFPIFWKDFNFAVGGLGVQVVKAAVLLVLYVGVAFVVYYQGRRDFVENMGIVLMVSALVVAYLELIYYSATTLNSEAFGVGERGQTLPGLVMLPVTPSRIVFEKGAACLSAMVPYAAFLGIGALMNPRGFSVGARALVVHPGVWVLVGYLVLFLYLNTYFSLVLKRTGFLLSFGIMLLGQFMVRSMFFTGLMMVGMMRSGGMRGFVGELFMASFDIAFIAVIIWLLHRGVLRRIESVAGE